MLHQGFRANSPVEYFEDALKMQGPCPDHDLRDATVRARLLEMAKAPPEADVPNLWEWGTPCTTFCDFQRLNALRPEGARADEVQGNDFAAFASELCLELRKAGRVFGFESSAPSGTYPKIWDLPCMQRLREQTPMWNPQTWGAQTPLLRPKMGVWVGQRLGLKAKMATSAPSPPSRLENWDLGQKRDFAPNHSIRLVRLRCHTSHETGQRST